MKEASVLLRARVPTERYRNAERILERLGMNPGDAVNLLMAQIELHQGIPFEVSLRNSALLSADEQGQVWTEALGAY